MVFDFWRSSPPPVCWIVNQFGTSCSLGTCPPKTKLKRGLIITPPLRKLWFSESTHFLKSIQTTLELSQSYIFKKNSPVQGSGGLSKSNVKMTKECPKFPVMCNMSIVKKLNSWTMDEVPKTGTWHKEVIQIFQEYFMNISWCFDNYYMQLKNWLHYVWTP